jgi:hypothetical protein
LSLYPSPKRDEPLNEDSMIYNEIYCEDEHGEAVKKAIEDLSKQHPEWDLDIGDWEIIVEDDLEEDVEEEEDDEEEEDLEEDDGKD